MIFRSPYDREFEREQEIEHEAYQRGASNILNKVRAEINDIEEGISSYHNDRPWLYKDEVLEIIDKYRKGANE